MSRRFVAGSAQWFGATVTPPAYPFSMAAWFWPNSSAAQTVMAFAKSTDAGNYHVLLLSGGNMLAQSQDGGGADNASLAFPYIASWQLVAGIWASATSRQLFVGNRYSAVNASSITPTGLTELNIGNLSSYNIYADGLIAHPTVWDAALSMGEIRSMAAGRLPELVRPQNLWAYGGFDELKASAPIMCSVRGAPIVLTDHGGVGAVSNAPPIRFERRRRFYFVSAPAGGALLSVTLDALTSSATGAVAISGAVASTLGAVTSSAAGAVAIVGAGASTLGDVTLSSAGVSAQTGSLGVALGGITLVSTGVQPGTGSLGLSLGDIALSSTGAQLGLGTSAITLGAIAATAKGFGQGSALFDGTGNNYLKIACPTELKTYPFWVAAHAKWYRQPEFADVNCIWSAERTASAGANGIGFGGVLTAKSPQARRYNDTTVTSALSDESALTDPFWDSITFEFISATDCRVYINGTLEKTSVTNITPDMTAGSPEFRIGLRGFAGAPHAFHGSIANVVAGSGSLSAGDRTLHATFGSDYSAMTGAMHWWPLANTADDFIGSANMTEVGTMAYQAAAPVSIAIPTRQNLIDYVFPTIGMPSATVAVTAGGSPPITVTTNLASVEHLDGSYTGNDTAVASPFAFRHWHYIPTNKVTPRHLVIINPGHAAPDTAPSYGIDKVVQDLVGAGYDVLETAMPGYDPDGPAVSHDACASRLSASINPIEKFFAPIVMTLNTIASTYPKISMTGLSGGGWLSAHLPALETRINHAIVPVRGTIADRRAEHSSTDWEQFPNAHGYKAESIYYLLAATNRRVCFVHCPTDSVIAAKNKSGTGAYLDATDYDTKFLAPIRSVYPNASVAFYEDGGAGNNHFYTQWVIDNVLLPALATPLTSLRRNGGLLWWLRRDA